MTARLMATLLLALPASGQAQDDGMVRLRSTRSLEATVAALDSVIAARGLTLFSRVDHAANARGIGLELRPTVVFIFGNPQVGTRLMQCTQTAAIDLPLRMLVWKDSADVVWVGYVDPANLSARHNLQECGETIERVKTALAGLAATATGSTP